MKKEDTEIDEPLMTVAELASYLQVNIMTIYRWASTGKLPVMKAGGRLRFKREMVDEFLINKGGR